jgi:hypothetical protein
MIPKSGNRFSEKDHAQAEHDPEKACPALDAGWEPVFGKDHAQATKRCGGRLRAPPQAPKA